MLSLQAGMVQGLCFDGERAANKHAKGGEGKSEAKALRKEVQGKKPQQESPSHMAHRAEAHTGTP